MMQRPVRQRSVVLETVVRVISPTVMIVSLYLLFSGHNSPGGGFAGGLVAATVLILRFVARDDPTLLHNLPPEVLLGGGVTIAAVTGMASWIWKLPLLTAGEAKIQIPVFGDVKILSVLFFDIGIYIAIVGFVLMILRTLGEEDDA